uniref:LAGLIDADG endonuclease n=1 Tax=Elmerina hispida TaxID=1245649 RepID=UPI0030020347|nr:LAGLIDADG endonuclease [Elmerina hispida]
MIRPNYTPHGIPLEPQWISGFTEGDASFSVSIKSSGQTIAVYSIGLNEREEPLLVKIQSFYRGARGIGNINKTPNNKAVYFSITAINHLNSIIVNHFESYPLLGAKKPNYLIWREILSIMIVKDHRTLEGKIKIKSLIEKLNK